jgi:ABC-type glycerol-3-phosphate transport system substrate-binding protein
MPPEPSIPLLVWAARRQTATDGAAPPCRIHASNARTGGGPVIRKSTVALLCCVLLIGLGAWNAHAQKRTLTIWSPQDQWKKSLDYYEKNLPEFAKKHPDVEVKYVHIPYEGHDAKYLTAFAGKSGAPDIYMGKVAYYAGAIGVADPAPADLQAAWNRDLIDVTQDFFKVKGQWYGYPVSSDLGMMLYYNVDQFKEAGLDPNHPPRTFAEMLEYAKKLVKRDATGKIVRNGLAVRYDGAPIGLADKALPFIHAFGGRLYAEDGKSADGTFNGKAAVAGLDYMFDLVHKSKVASLELGKPVDTFAAGKSAMIFREGWLEGWMITHAPNINYKIAALPEGPAGYPGLSLLFGWSWMVFNGGPNKDIAWDWMRAQATDKVDLDLAKLEGYLPVRKHNFNDPFVSKRKDYAANQVILGHPRGPYYDHPFINEIGTQAGEAVQATLFGTEAQKSADDAVRKMDRTLRRK